MIIWLASYPRSGNTLLRLILKRVFKQSTYSKHDDVNDIGADARLAEEVGHQFLGAAWPDAFEKMSAADKLHLVKTHDIPEDAGKAIYVVRDGRAACRSFYHYLKDFPSVRSEFSLGDVIAGFTPFGSWGDHLDHWEPQQRSGILLVKYENLIASPAIEIQRIAEFTSLKPLRNWKNNFQKLHKMNPRFFRAGSKGESPDSMDSQDQAIFWSQHGDWMRRLDYPLQPAIEDVTRPSRRLISGWGREYFNLRERVFIAERRVVDLRVEGDSKPASIDLAEHQTAVDELRSELTLAQEQAAVAGKQSAASQEQAEKLRQDAASLRTEVLSSQAEVLATRQEATARAAEAQQRQNLLQTENHRLVAEVKVITQRQLDAESRLAESRSLVSEHLARTGDAAAETHETVATHLSNFSTTANDLRSEISQLISQWNQTASLLKERLARSQNGRAVASARLRQSRRSLNEADAKSAEQTAELRKQAMHLSALSDELAATQNRRTELQLLLSKTGHLAMLTRNEYIAALKERDKSAADLCKAVIELNTRMRMLLTSRLLHFGWKVGLGKTPYWANPASDEVTPVLESLSAQIPAKQPALESLRRIISIAHSQYAAHVNDAGEVEVQSQRSSQPRAEPQRNTDMASALRHLVEKGFRPSAVLDVGAAKGYWSVMAAGSWPTAEFFLIDPLRQSEPALLKLCEDPRFHYQLVAAGAEPGESLINVTPEPDGSSLLAFNNADPSRQQKVVVETIDRLINAGKIKPPQMAKLDVQGFELQVLRGGTKLFESAEVFIIEANIFEFMPGCPRLHEVVDFMARRGFYPFDFAGFLRRPFDNDLGQLDIVFVRHDSPMMASNHWDMPENGGDPPHRLYGVESKAEKGGETPPLQVDRDSLEVSVIICTKDPRMEILRRTLDSVDRQTLEKSRFELIIVDNNSSPPLSAADLQSHPGIRLRLIVEPIAGLSRARRAGIAAAKADLFVFVDDDNFLEADYLQRAVEIARTESRIGLFGGISVAELESPIPKWKQAVLPYLGIRNHGPEPITAFADHWGEWEPIGAGMVARREVAEKFVEMFHASNDARQLGRNGNALLSGEDSLFARAAHRVGYSCSYQPALKLVHFIKESRTKLRYLTRLLEGHGRSYVLLNRAIGKPTDPLKTRTAIARLIYRMRTVGRAGAITWFWDLGYAAEKRNEHGAKMKATNTGIESEPRVSDIEQLEGAGRGI